MMLLSPKSMHAFKWSLLGEGVSKSIGPLLFLILARLLVPEDFGIIASATLVISFSQIFSDAGLAKALVQKQTQTDESANAIFWLNLIIGIVIVLAVYLAATWIAIFFHDDRIALVIRIMSLQILLAAFSATHIAILQKKLGFKKLFWVRLASTTTPALVSIPLAVLGFGYWALVAGSLVGQLAQLIALWHFSNWRPRCGIDRYLARELLHFGKWTAFSGCLSWFYMWMDAIVVGHYLGSNDMGIYRTGSTFVTMILGLIFAPMLPVLYSLFSSSQHDLPLLRNSLSKVAQIIAMISLPAGALLYLLSNHIEMFLFGTQWAGIASVIAILALMHSASWIVGANGEVYRAIGMPHVETWTNLAFLLIYTIGYLTSIQHGLKVFLITRLLLALIAILGHIIVAKNILGMPFTEWKVPSPIIATLFAAIIAMLPNSYIDNSAVSMLITSLTFTVLYCLIIFMVDKEFIIEIFTQIKRTNIK